jgi:hypothetical protein
VNLDYLDISGSVNILHSTYTIVQENINRMKNK